MTHPEVNNSNKRYIWFSSLVSSLALSQRKERLWNPGLLTVIRGSPSPLQSVYKRRTKKWPIHRISCIVLASFWFSLSLDTLESFWKLHLIYSKRSQQQRFLLHCYIHSWSCFTVSISVGFFFLTSTVQHWMKNTDAQGCRWNKTNYFSVCIRLYRNRVPIFSELKHQFC